MEEKKRYLVWDFYVKVSMQEENEWAFISDYSFNDKISLKIPLRLKDADFIEKELIKWNLLAQKIDSIMNFEQRRLTANITKEQEVFVENILNYLSDELGLDINFGEVIDLLYNLPEIKKVKSENITHYMFISMTD